MIKDSQFQSRYDAPSIWLHWVTAILVVGQWIGAKTIDYWPRGYLRVDARSFHITFGLILVVVFTARIAWRLGPRRKLPPAESGFWGMVAGTMHWLLYVLIACTLLLGLTLMTIRGDSYFGLFALPSFGAATSQLRSSVAELHDLCATTLLITAGFHASAGILHPYLFGSNVLRRMWPRIAQ
jgi:cytochrome b561